MSMISNARRLSLYLVKALLALLSLAALASYPARAQVSSPGGQWVVQDSNGKTLTTNPDGSYTLYGPVTETASEKYPGVLAAAHNNPQLDGAYVPSELSPNPDPIYNGGSTGFTSVFGAFAVASNADQMNGGYIPYLGSISAPVFLNGSITDNITGTLTQTWTWVPAAAPNGQPAPAVLNLLVSAPVSVDISPNYSNPSLSSGLTGTASASNGLGDTANMTEGSVYAKQGLPGKHLVQFPVGAGGSVTVTVSAQGSVSLTNSVTYGALFPTIPQPYPTDPYVYRATNGFAYSMGDADVSASAQQDHRAVTTSASVDPTLAKGPRYNGDHSLMFDIYGDELFTPHPHAPTADGTMYGDLGIDEVANIPLNSITVDYQGNRSGNWHIAGDTDWWFTDMTDSISTPDHQGDTMTSSSPNISNFAVEYNGDTVAGLPGGADNSGDRVTLGTNHIHLTYTDGGDGAIATANYYMDIHHSWEWVASKKLADGFWRNVALTVANPGYAGNNGTISCTWSEDNPFVAEASISNNDLVAGAFTVAGAATPLPGLNALLTFIGFAADKFGPKPDSGTADFNGCWGSRWSTFSTPPPANYATMTPQQQSDFRQYYTMAPSLFLHYTTNYYLGDHWGPNGYIEQVPRAFATLDMRPDGLGPAAMDWCGAFQFNGDTNTPQPPTHGN